MARKRHKLNEIVTKLRQVEVLRGQGMKIADAVRQIGVSELAFYRWRKEQGGMSRDQLRQLGMVFQSFNLWPHLSVLENVTEGPMHVSKIGKDEANACAMKTLSKVGIAEKKDAYPYMLSG